VLEKEGRAGECLMANDAHALAGATASVAQEVFAHLQAS
jgi:hypothetical protein